ncbi:MAG: hypothetical protein R2697_00045 [Ilumatobacteraceae bacterium]
MTYTGAVTGGPNKTVLLATLVDATDTTRRRTVVFKLGTPDGLGDDQRHR